jgi:hypothetical protein
VLFLDELPEFHCAGVRPAVVVQADALNGLIDDTVLVSITRRSRGAPAVEAVIDPASFGVGCSPPLPGGSVSAKATI